VGRGRRVRAARTQKQAREQDLDDLEFPDDALLDASRCPVDGICVGCGGREALAAKTAAFSRPGGGFDVACATVCRTCDGRSFLRMLGQNALDTAFARHGEHGGGAAGASLVRES
jgi:hypothetical protein